MSKLQWGLLAAGNIARAFAGGVTRSNTGELAAVASRSLEKAEKFADEFGIPIRHGSYEALLADDRVEAVYISTPHPLHPLWAIRAAEAGKHILCEKPIALNHADAMAIVDAAAQHDVFLMEAFMYRCHPQTAKIVELVRDGAIGEVRLIRATFGFHAGYNLEGRLLCNALGGGGILDVGCYATSISRLIAGASLGRHVAEPIEVIGAGHVGAESHCDEWATGILRFENDIIAQVSTSVQLGQDNTVTVFGSAGRIEVPSPWFCSGREGGSCHIVVHRNGRDAETIEITTEKGLYELEADMVANNVAKRQAPPPAKSWADTLGNMMTCERWLRAVGVTYPADTIAGRQQTAAGRPLARAAGQKMKYGRVRGLEKDVSKLIMGCDNQQNIAHAAVMFDAYFEAGGNAFDTGFIYGGGRQEKLLGEWVSARGVRDQVAIIGKGAHTPACNPKALTEQLLITLDRLRTDHVDIYLMHRDNPEVPVGEFVDVLNEHVAAGRIKVFGGSNWQISRLAEANAYAAKHGKQGYAVLCNNLSLARMVDAVWEGCISAADPASRQWLEETQTALFSWSSQARGFFVPGRAAPDRTEDPELVRCWYSEDNFQRLERAKELAAKKGCEPINIAAAYVLEQPFPAFALFGPRVLSEMRSSLKALEVDLTADERTWLNLES